LIGSFSISHRIFPKIFEYAESADILEFGPWIGLATPPLTTLPQFFVVDTGMIHASWFSIEKLKLSETANGSRVRGGKAGQTYIGITSV
jgi:hypothetical protein